MYFSTFIFFTLLTFLMFWAMFESFDIVKEKKNSIIIKLVKYYLSLKFQRTSNIDYFGRSGYGIEFNCKTRTISENKNNIISNLSISCTEFEINCRHPYNLYGNKDCTFCTNYNKCTHYYNMLKK